MNKISKFRSVNLDYNGFFVVLEGIDGSGKSLQVKNVVNELNKIGIKAKATQEPRKEADIGLLLRKYLQDKNSIAEVDALLFAADRIEHYYLEILPLLKEGYVVVSDRYYYSSFVYQSFSGVELEWIQEINKFVLNPDLAIYLDLPVPEAMKRVNNADRSDLEKFEQQSSLEKISKLYIKYIEFEHLHPINAEKPKEEVTKTIIKMIQSKISK
jgi:dTMP kinase